MHDSGPGNLPGPLSSVGSVVGRGGARSQEAAQRVQARRPGGPGGTAVHPGVEGTLLLVVRAAAWALRGAGLEVREVLDDPGRVDVGEPEGPDAGGVDDPALVVGQRERDR